MKTPQELADAVGASLAQSDLLVNELLGISLVEIAPGRALCRLTVGEHHLNSHRVCHGGILFTLADAALAYASCSTNRTGVTLAASVSFVRAARLDDILTACASLETDGRRSSMSTARVTDQNGQLIALVHGTSLRFDVPIIQETGGSEP